MPKAERSKTQNKHEREMLASGGFVIFFPPDLVFWHCQLFAIPEVFMHTGVALTNSPEARHTLPSEWRSSFLLNGSFKHWKQKQQHTFQYVTNSLLKRACCLKWIIFVCWPPADTKSSAFHFSFQPVPFCSQRRNLQPGAAAMATQWRTGALKW